MEIFIALEDAARDMCLIINEEKTNFMVVSTKAQDVQSLRIYNYTFKGVTQLKYLGSVTTFTNELKMKIRNRILMSNRCYFGLKNQLKSKFVSMKIKVNLCKILALHIASIL